MVRPAAPPLCFSLVHVLCLAPPLASTPTCAPSLDAVKAVALEPERCPEIHTLHAC